MENLVGCILAPLVSQNNLTWFWFSRYVTDVSDSGDCAIAQIPGDFVFSPGNFYKSLRFRFSIKTEAQDAFEANLTQAINDTGACISDIRDYELIDDVASDRFLGDPRSYERRQKRANLVVHHFLSTSRLFIDCIQGPNQHGYFFLESDPNSGQNPHGSIFESVHHIFCNQTDVPLSVLVSQTTVGTYWSPPQGQVDTIRIQY